MSTSSEELDRFLADLSVRRQRLLSLVGADESAAGLVEELLELSEQLLVADEELRVQQEELESTRQRMDALAVEWSTMFESSSAALVLTDHHGVVLQATRAASQLVLQPPSRRTPRPIATWFDVPDRSRIRSLISQRSLGRPLVLPAAVLRRSDGSTVRVDVRVTPTPSSAHDQVVLSWELSPTTTPELHLVGDDLPRTLAQDLAESALRLTEVQGLSAVLAAAADEALRVVPGVENAVIVSTRRGLAEVLASAGAAEVDLGAHDGVSVPLPFAGHPETELRLHPAPSGQLSAVASQIADLLGVHLQVAIDRAAVEEGLRRAAESRQRIGQAVGVLVERRRTTPEEAFAELVQQSQQTNVKLREVARIVVETGLDPDQIKVS
jgi:PAS domain S-box-containing protein